MPIGAITIGRAGQELVDFDGLANLFNSVVLAASRKTTCYGTVLLLNDEYIAAREVRKTDAVRSDTFEGGRFGVIGGSRGWRRGRHKRTGRRGRAELPFDGVRLRSDLAAGAGDGDGAVDTVPDRARRRAADFRLAQSGTVH